MSGRKYIVLSEDILPNVMKVLDLIVMAMRPKGKKNAKNFHDVYSYSAAEIFKPYHARSTGKHCVALLNKCLYSGRYEEAVKLLWMLYQDQSVFEIFLYKASMLVLENLQLEDKDETIMKLVDEVVNMYRTNKKEVQLEYVIYGLKNNVFDLRSSTQAIVARKPLIGKHAQLDPIFDAYSALLDYVEWSRGIDGGFQSSQSKMSSEAEQVILKLQTLIDTPGDWDVFVLKLVELLDKCGRNEEIEDILLKYVQSNPDHINSYIYLCSYLSHYAPDSENLIPHLKALAKLSPSDERVLIWLELWKNSGQKLKKTFKVLFIFLDYPSNGKNIKAWKLFSDLLYQAKLSENEKVLQTIQSCWKSRCKSWFWIHFNPSQIDKLKVEDIQLAAFKVNFLSYFEKDHIYNEQVLKKFPSIQDLLEILADSNS